MKSEQLEDGSNEVYTSFVGGAKFGTAVALLTVLVSYIMS